MGFRIIDFKKNKQSMFLCVDKYTLCPRVLALFQPSEKATHMNFTRVGTV